MLRQLLHDAGAPAGFTVSPRESLDTKNIPVFDTKSNKPVYSKLGYVIVMKKVDLGTVVKFLYSYYRLNLLHQITYLDIKRKDSEGVGSRARAGGDRNDLEVTIHTDAIILDGAENRRTLLPMPVGAAVGGGQAGHYTLLNTP